MSTQQTRARGRVLMVTNHKGGCGKTSNTLALAAALAKLGRRCLVIDFDGEPNLTELLGAPTSPGWPSAYELITQREDSPQTYDVSDYIITGESEAVRLPQNIDLIPGSARIEHFHDWLLGNKYVILQKALEKPFEELRRRYDYILLDTPPRTSDATVAAMFVTDFVIFSTFPQPPAVRRIVSAVEDLKKAKSQGGAPAEAIGIIYCGLRQPETRLAAYLRKQLLQHFRFAEDDSPMKFTQDVDYGVAFDEAWEMGQTIFEYEGTHKICGQYLAIAEELEVRIAARSGYELAPLTSNEAALADIAESAANE